MTAPENQKITIGLVQMPAATDPEKNRAAAVEGVRSAADRGARIVCLQELFATPYFCRTEDPAHFKLAESVPGPTTETVAAVAREKGVVVIAPVFEKRADGIYHNSAAVIDADGSIAGLYRKMHIPDEPHYYEKFYFAPGDLGFQAFKTRYAKIGVLICWDQWFPEAARVCALKGAQILFYPTAIGRHEDEPADEFEKCRDAWETVQRGHAIANGVYVAAVNRVGREGPLDFWGGSFIADPFGERMARAGQRDEEILTAVCDLARIGEYRQSWPFFRDRRIDAYQELNARFLDQ